MNIAEKILRLKQDMDDLYNANQGSSTDEWFDKYQTLGEARAYTYAFGYACWDDSIYFPVREINFDKGLSYTTSVGAFRQSFITDTKVPIICTKSGQGGYVFQGSKIVTIHKLVVSESTNYDNWFNNADRLENITFEGTIGNSISFPHSPLTKASITHIVEHLSSTKTGLTATFNKASKESAFTENEWITLKATKSNWTIQVA